MIERRGQRLRLERNWQHLKKYRWDKKYLYWGVTAFFVIVCSITFFWMIQRWEGMWTTLKLIFKILSPFVWGMVITYLLTPLLRVLEINVFIPFAKRIYKTGEKREKRIQSTARMVSIFASLTIGMVTIFSLLWMILPQLYRSVESIVINMQEYVPNGIRWIEETLKNYPDIENFIVSLIGNISEALMNWIKNSLMPQMSDTISFVSTSLLSVVTGVANILIGIIISCYINYNKEKFGAQIKKILYSVLSDKLVRRVLQATKCVDEAFTGFISGKVLDSFIVGVICYIGCWIMKMPYATLVSVIVGVANIIPFFGPFIGGIPGTLIIFMVSPAHGIVFGIFVILLQQFDGNILGPKILGSSTGLNGFWIMFAIIVGGGLFGIVGMLCGVPVFSVIYTGIRHLVNSRLENREKPSDTETYMDLAYFDEITGEPIKKISAVLTAEKKVEESAEESTKSRED